MMACARLPRSLSKKLKPGAKVQRAITQPAIVVVVAIVVILVMMVYVLPKLINVFNLWVPRCP